jgi:hypothetical protein
MDLGKARSCAFPGCRLAEVQASCIAGVLVVGRDHLSATIHTLVLV